MVVAASLLIASFIRPLDALSSRLVQDGALYSHELGRLEADLESRKLVVVYVTTQSFSGHRGGLNFVSHAGGLTYLIAFVNPQQTPTERLAVLAHELRHAVEVANCSAPVTSESEFRKLYQSIGFPADEGFESREALREEETVRRELLAGRGQANLGGEILSRGVVVDRDRDPLALGDLGAGVTDERVTPFYLGVPIDQKPHRIFFLGLVVDRLDLNLGGLDREDGAEVRHFVGEERGAQDD